MENVNPAKEKIVNLIDLINNEEYSKASYLSNQLLKENKRSYILHNLQGIISLHISKYDEAIISFLQAIKLNKNFFDPYNRFHLQPKHFF